MEDINMALYFDKPENAEPNIGAGFAKGINNLLQKKIADMQKHQGIKERKQTYKQADLPEWLAELPDDFQKLFIKEYKFLPEDQKQQVHEQLNQMSKEYWPDWGTEEQGHGDQAQGILPQQLQSPGLGLQEGQQPNPEQLQQAGQMFKNAPLQPGIEAGKAKNVIPGLNTLAQAAEGFAKQPQQESEVQSFPEIGHGIKGQPSPMQEQMPHQTTPREIGPKKYTMVPRTTGKGSLANAKFEASQRKQEFTEQQSLRSFLNTEETELKEQRKIKKLANTMLDNLEKNYKKWPGAFSGNLSRGKQELFLRDPDVRKYMADAQEMVLLKSKTGKGLPSKYRIQMEEAAKANFTMPIRTQKEVLERIASDSDTAEERNTFILKQRDSKGRMPLDLRERVAEFELAEEKPLQYPQYYKDGTEIEDDDGKNYVLKNGNWQEK